MRVCYGDPKNTGLQNQSLQLAGLDSLKFHVHQKDKFGFVYRRVCYWEVYNW